MKRNLFFLTSLLLVALLAQPLQNSAAAPINQANETVFDFAANADHAKWKSGAGVLPFPGTSGDYRGYAQLASAPTWEDGTVDTATDLLTVPQLKFNGYIQGTYPEFTVQKGDHFQATVGCEFGATKCLVTYRLDYTLSNGLTRVFWQWKEANDGRVYHADIDLSPLAGQKVKFILTLLATGIPDNDRALWGAPRIVREGDGSVPLPSLTPTNTPFSTPLPPVASTSCDRAAFIADITVRDNTSFTPGAAFTKGWRLKNMGTCTWTKDYTLVFYDGEQMGAPTSVNMPWVVVPGAEVEIAINAVAPITPGSHQGFWILRNPSGVLFGVGANGATPIWVLINVIGVAPAFVTGYDFVTEACNAQWKSGAGLLPCPGTDGDAKGFVLIQSAPKLEDGTLSSSPGLLTSPQNKFNGYIQGTYPTFTVQPGDRFQTTVGCESGANCFVTFRLDYLTPGGATRIFWQWKEKSDGRTYNADLDLTPLAGQSVRFILTMLATGSPAGDRAVWATPRIARIGNIPVTITPAPPTITPVPTGLPGPVVTSPDIKKLFMQDASHGWALGNAYVLRTTNGGVTWYNVTMPGVDAVGNGYFQNANKGWVMATLSGGSVLLHTIDGGRTWTTFNNLPFNGGYIQFLDDLHGFVLSGGPVGMFKNPVWLYQTSDGGATWALKYTNDPLTPGAGTSLPFSGNKNGMTFRDTLRGWVSGESPLTGSVYLYKTNDSGTTWALQTLPLPSGYSNAPMSTVAPTFFNANDGVLPVWMSLDVGKRDLFIYVTHNGGTTWTRSTTFARQGWNADFVSVNDGFTWNAGGYLQVTHNAGGSWSQVTSNVNFGDSIPSLDFVSTTTGWAIQSDFNTGLTSLYRTTDGGSTWTLLFGNQPPPTSTATPAPPSTGLAAVQSVDVQIVEGQPLQVNAVVSGSLPDTGCTRIASTDQTRTNNTFQLTLTTSFDPNLECTNTPIIFSVLIPLDVSGLQPASYTINANGVEKTFELLTRDPATFAQNVVDALNAQNFDLLKLMMDQSFVFAFWQSEGFSSAPDQAIQQLQTNYIGPTTHLTADASKDLNTLLGGLDPYGIMGLDPANAQALFVSGWGLDGKGEALLYVKRLPDGSLYWYGVLIAPSGFIPATPTP